MAVADDVDRVGVCAGIEAVNLTVKLRRKTVLDRLDLNVSPGVHGLLGKNGAGKTTLLRTIATIVRPTSGSLSVLDTQLPASIAKTRALRARIGYAPQAPSVLRQLTAHQQVTYAGWLKGLSEADANQRAGEALARVRLGERATDRVGSLSGGMLKRLGIASAIVTAPQMLLLDEPTAGLDPEQRVIFRELVRELAADCTVLLSTHLVDDVAAICDQVTLIDVGRRVFTGTPPAMLAAGSPSGETDVDYLGAFMSLTGDA